MPRKPPKKSPKDCIGGGFMCARPATKKVRGEWYCDIHLPKKSPAKARKSPGPELIRGMKQLRDRIDEFNKENWCGQCGQKLVTGGCGPTHAIKMLEFAKKHLLPTDSPTRDEGRKLEEVRKLAEKVRDRAFATDFDLGQRAMARDILHILNSTPTAKGGRK